MHMLLDLPSSCRMKELLLLILLYLHRKRILLLEVVVLRLKCKRAKSKDLLLDKLYLRKKLSYFLRSASIDSSLDSSRERELTTS